MCAAQAAGRFVKAVVGLYHSHTTKHEQAVSDLRGRYANGSTDASSV